MVNQKRRTKVEINEKEYTIVGDKSSAHVNLVADTINKQIEELTSLSSNLSKEEQAILMAVNAISDQITTQQKMIKLEEELDSLKNR
ncbi:MAG TPA: cell division protein ZapA [Atopostipes sp.]|nr:cell division protein ZapA [Atopostipes sp.]